MESKTTNHYHIISVLLRTENEVLVVFGLVRLANSGRRLDLPRGDVANLDEGVQRQFLVATRVMESGLKDGQVEHARLWYKLTSLSVK